MENIRLKTLKRKWNRFFRLNRTNLHDEVIENLKKGSLNPRMLGALDDELAYEYLDKAGLTDKFLKNCIWNLCKKFSSEKALNISKSSKKLVLELPENGISQEKKSLLLELLDSKETWRTWHYPSIATRVAVNENIRQVACDFFTEKYQLKNIELNDSKEAVKFGVIATIHKPNDQIDRYFIKPHQNRSKSVYWDRSPILWGELVLYKWLELMGIGADVEFLYGEYGLELYICSKDLGVDFLTFEVLTNQPSFENEFNANPEYKEGLVLMDLICKLFCLRDLSESPGSFGFIGTQLRIINFQVIPEYMNRDVLKLFTSKSTIPNASTSRLAKLFAIQQIEKMQLVSTVSSKLLQNDIMKKKLDEAYLFVKDFLEDQTNIFKRHKFTLEKQYLKKVKANIKKLGCLILKDVI